MTHKLMLENKVRFGQWNLFDSTWDWRGPRTRNQKVSLLGLLYLWWNFARLNIQALHHAIQYEKVSTCIHKSTWRIAFSLWASVGVVLQASWTHVWSEYRKAWGWRGFLLSPRVDGIVLLFSSPLLPSSADNIFVFRGKLMGEENFNFPLTVICHWRISYLQLSSQCTTVLLPTQNAVCTVVLVFSRPHQVWYQKHLYS